jgi:hypothetical protein
MSDRKPETPRDDDGPAGSGRNLSDIGVGKRFASRESDVWQIEQSVAVEGDLPDDANRCIPLCDHPEHGDDLNADEIRNRIERESETPVPNKSRIGHLNDLLAEVMGDE